MRLGGAIRRGLDLHRAAMRAAELAMRFEAGQVAPQRHGGRADARDLNVGHRSHAAVAQQCEDNLLALGRDQFRSIPHIRRH